LQLLQSTPLHPIAEWGRARFGGADVPADRRLAELESSLAQVRLNPAENVPLLAPLLDIPLPEQRKPNLAPAELRRRQLAALTNWAIASARVQPLVLAFEDLHWADPTTLDVLHGIAERGALAPLFAVATTRPEFRPPWSMHSHHGTVSLAPLDRRQVRDMVAQLSAQQALLREVVEDVVTRTGGVPLFIEEVTRLLLERGQQGGMQEIPPTLQQLLTARLDRLGSAREVADRCVGRDFSYALIRAVANMEDAALQAALERLAEADILLVQGLPPESVYRFKHALIQDAAYENLLKSRRQALHRSVAEALRDNLAATAAAEPELLAHHFTQAGLTEAAIEWWGQAGQRSLERSALVEAAQQLTRALVQIATLPGTPALRRQQIKLQVSLMTPLVHVKGYAAPETKAAAERARLLIEQAEALGEPPEDPLLLFVVLYGFWAANYIAFNGDIVRDRGAVLRLGRETSNHSSADDRPSPHGHFPAEHGRNRRSSRALRQGHRAVRPHRASDAGDKVWCRCPRVDLVVSVVGALDARVSRSRAGRRRGGAERCARDRPSRHINVCAELHVTASYLPRRLRKGKGGRRRTRRSGG
jgi:predicted ATPase